ncbi:hypothetical protein JXA02_05150, partial [candidate division KSB1 bacterium]
MKRRSFLKTIPIGLGAMALSCDRKKNKFTDQLRSFDDSLYHNFLHPKASARPFYRWWWNDNRVTAKEVRRELQVMAQQGAGGVEINPIALPDIYKDLAGEKLTWLSREWNQVLLAAVDEAQKLEMIVDLIVGTGWPFGGKFLSDKETIQGIAVKVHTIKGPISLEKEINSDENPAGKIMQIKLFPLKITAIDEGIDLFFHLEKGRILRVDIPRGEWNLYIVTWHNKFRDVMYGAQGADGPALDHFNKAAVEKYLRRMSDALNPLFGGSMGKALRALFCDSIELEGANWTTDMADEFRRRFGYDVEPYLPLLLGGEIETDANFADTLRRVKFDFSTLLAELFMNRFILPYHNWCLQNGVVSRYQAYGHPWLYTDLLDGYLAPDIPEGDQWLYNAGWVKHHRIDDIRYAIWNKYASSAGHLGGKKIISCEAMTNTRGLWEATLEYMKQATDLNIVGGINHFILHGFNYSPPDAEFPGWIRFGAYYNENNTWWPYLRLWSDYAARLCQIFQDSHYKAQAAILGPTPDVWSEHGLDRNPWNTTPAYLHDLWQALNHHGYCSDYINATILRNATFAAGKLHFGPMSYDLLICCDIHSVEIETAQAMLDFAESGGKILFVNATPRRSPGFLDAQKNDALVQEIVKRLLAEKRDNVQLQHYDENSNLTAWMGGQLSRMHIAPAVQISNPDERLFMINSAAEGRDLFFFCNSNRARSIEFEATFADKDKTAWEWDAETGAVSAWATTARPLKIELKPLQSLLLVLSDQPADEFATQYDMDARTSVEIKGPWHVEFKPVKGESFHKVLTSLIDFAAAGPKNFAGTAIYKTQFSLAQTANMMLDCGAVHDIAKVILNGKPLGIRWWGEKKFFIRDELVDGVNQLEIRVT